METYPEQFPNESQQPDPNPRAEDRVSDAIQDSDHAGFDTREGQPDIGAPEMDFTLSLPGVGDFLVQVKGGQKSPERSK